MTKKERYDYRRANNLCTTCGKPVTDGKANCPECRKKVSDRNKFQYQFCRDNGICPNCKKRKAAVGTVLCEVCRAYERKVWYETSDNYKSKKSKKSKTRRRKMIKNGICPKCGKPVTTGRVNCDDCLAYMREQNREYRKRNGARHVGIPKKDWNQYGWCNICGVAVNNGAKVCDPCKERLRGQATRMRARLAEKHAEWAEKGLCGYCGKNPVIPGKRVCIACNERLNAIRNGGGAD